MTERLLFIQLAATIYMTGLIWFVQIVHYPLLARIGPNEKHLATEDTEFTERI